MDANSNDAAEWTRLMIQSSKQEFEIDQLKDTIRLLLDALHVQYDQGHQDRIVGIPSLERFWLAYDAANAKIDR